MRGRGGYLYRIVHGRSCMTIGPRMPTMPGRSASGFHGPGRQTLQAPSAKRCGVLGESHGGVHAFVVRLGHSSIGHASLSRRGSLLTPKRDNPQRLGPLEADFSPRMFARKRLKLCLIPYLFRRLRLQRRHPSSPRTEVALSLLSTVYQTFPRHTRLFPPSRPPNTPRSSLCISHSPTRGG